MSACSSNSSTNAVSATAWSISATAPRPEDTATPPGRRPAATCSAGTTRRGGFEADVGAAGSGDRRSVPVRVEEDRDGLHHHARRRGGLLQGLGHGSADRAEPWLAVERRQLGGANAVPGVPRLPLHRPGPPTRGGWRVRPTDGQTLVARRRFGHLRSL